MDLPNIKTATTASVQVYPLLAMDGRVMQSVMIKDRFQFGAANPVRCGGSEIQYCDVPWDDAPPEAGSTKIPADMCLHKPGTDVVFVGSAVVPDGVQAPHIDAMIRVGPVEKQLRVFGPRFWETTVTGDHVPSTPVSPVETTPLRWEAAFGGYDASIEGRAPAEEARNPIGRGVIQDRSTLRGTLAHSIEDPRHPFESLRSPPAPAGVAPIGRHWEPRRRYAGTYDETWQSERMPLPPFDFDDRHNQCAAPEMIVDGYLRGGEPVELLNLTAEGATRFHLPELRFFVGAKIDGEVQAFRVVLDTVLIDADEGHLDLTWRAKIPTPRPRHRLRYIQINEQELRR